MSDTWSAKYPGRQTRPSNLQSAPSLLSTDAAQNVRQIALRRLQTPCDLLEQREGDSEFGGGGSAQSKVTVVVASTLCDIEPLNTTAETPPKGFENETLFRSYFPAATPVKLSARLRVPGWLPVWASREFYALGAKIAAPGDFGNGHFYECLQAGQAGLIAPIFPEKRGGAVNDGGAVWREAGDAFTLEVVLHDGERSRDSLLCVLCKLLR